MDLALEQGLVKTGPLGLPELVSGQAEQLQRAWLRLRVPKGGFCYAPEFGSRLQELAQAGGADAGARMLEEARAALLGTGAQALACEMTEETGGVAAAFQLRTPFGEGEISLFFPKEGSSGDGGNHLGADAGGL